MKIIIIIIIIIIILIIINSLCARTHRKLRECEVRIIITII